MTPEDFEPEVREALKGEAPTEKWGHLSEEAFYESMAGWESEQREVLAAALRRERERRVEAEATLARHKPVDDRAFDLAGEVPELGNKLITATIRAERAETRAGKRIADLEAALAKVTGQMNAIREGLLAELNEKSLALAESRAEVERLRLAVRNCLASGFDEEEMGRLISLSLSPDAPKSEWYAKDKGGTVYVPGRDPEVTCWHCGKTFLCDPMDATCRMCDAPYAKERCAEFGFKPAKAGEDGE